MRSLLLVMILIGLAAPAAAQDESIARLDLPREVRGQLDSLLAHRATRRIDGPYTLDAGTSVNGNVVVFGGPVLIDGHISGTLVVVGSNVELGSGAMISGDLTVAGGEAYGVEVARVLGTVTMYGEGFRFFGEQDEIVAFGRRRRVYDRDIDRYWGRSSLSLRTGINYNRVEGLPIHVGPVLETGGRYRTRLQAAAILRTGGGIFDSDHMGYDARLEQFLGRAFRLGAGVHSVIQPIESAGLTNLEASLSTFLFHNDLRDYYEREGFGVYARYAPRRSSVDASLTFANDRHRSVVPRNPWTLFGSDWRLQPAVGEGTLRTLTARLEYDRRDDEDFPIDGWLLRAEVGRGLGGSLQLPASRLNDSILVPAVPLNSEFNRAEFDLRVYRPFGPRGTLNFRVAAGGSLDGETLPPQFQHALGGAGSLPGYDVFSIDCGARSSIIRRNGHDLFGSYGCDRYVLGSIEYRGWFDVRFGASEDDDGEDWDYWHFDATPSWMFFFDAARGWSVDGLTRTSADSGVFYDAGAGILLGDIGIYAAIPLNGEDRGVNFFVRLGPRF